MIARRTIGLQKRVVRTDFELSRAIGQPLISQTTSGKQSCEKNKTCAFWSQTPLRMRQNNEQVRLTTSTVHSYRGRGACQVKLNLVTIGGSRTQSGNSRRSKRILLRWRSFLVSNFVFNSIFWEIKSGNLGNILAEIGKNVTFSKLGSSRISASVKEGKKTLSYM